MKSDGVLLADIEQRRAGRWPASLAVVLAPDEPDASVVPSDSEAVAITAQRCAGCHSGVSAPLGIRLVNSEQLQQHADAIQVMVKSGAMPPGNVTGLTAAEREQLVAWAAAHG